MWSLVFNSEHWKYPQWSLPRLCSLHCWHSCCMNLCKATSTTFPPPPHTHRYTFSSFHAKPLTLNFQLVNLLARFPSRWQVSRIKRISISSPILQNTRALEELLTASQWNHRTVMSSQVLGPPRHLPPASRPR